MEYGNEEHLDLRQRKTRKLLVEALAQLLEEKSFQELSVTDICRRAMVHRAAGIPSGCPWQCRPRSPSLRHPRP